MSGGGAPVGYISLAPSKPGFLFPLTVQGKVAEAEADAGKSGPG